MNITAKLISSILPGRRAVAAMTLAVAINLGAAAESSPLAAGHWVRIAVKNTGMQQITFDQLRQWGFNEPERVTVYGYGGAAFWNCWSNPDDPGYIPQQYSIVEGNRILFYGEGAYRPAFLNQSVSSSVTAVHNERNNASFYGYYLLTDSQPRQDIAALPHNYSSSAIETMHECINVFEDEETYPSGMGQHAFGKNIVALPEKSITYHCPVPNGSAGNFPVYVTNVLVGSGTSIRFRNQYPSGTSTGSINNSSLVTLNMTTGTADLSYSTNYMLSSSFKQINMPIGATSFDYKVGIDQNANMTYGANDYFGYVYRRKNVFEGPQMTAFFKQVYDIKRIRFENCNPNVQVWNIDNPFKVQPFVVEHQDDMYGKTTLLTFCNQTPYYLDNNSNGGRVIIFDPKETQYAVEYAGEITNNDLRSVEVPDMLIVTSGICAPQAERLAELHRNLLHQTVLVVNQQDVFNEFSSGTPAVNAVREFVKYLKSQPSSSLKHLLLFGATSNDMRGITANSAHLINSDNMILSYPTFDRERQSSNIKGFTSDIYFGVVTHCTSESDFIQVAADVNVGRLPAQNIMQATEAVDKIERYLTEKPVVDAVNRAVLLSESGDSHSHLRNSEKVATEFSNYDQATTTVKVYASFYPRGSGSAPVATKALKQALAMGAGYFNFSGHGKPDSFTRLDIWNLNDVNNTKYNIYPVAMFATCDSYMFDQLSTSLTERMVMMPDGGAIAAIGACRTVYEARNQSLNQAVSREYARSTDGTTTGDLFRLSVNNIAVNNPTITDLLVNDRCYNLCGDPGLPMYTATHDCVFITSIDGDTSDKYVLEPLQSHIIKGYVADTDGQVDTGFNGDVILTLYEVARDVATDDVSGDMVSIKVDEDQLVSVKTPVVNGQFTATVTTPMPSRQPGDNYKYNRMTLLAISDDNLMRRKGYSAAITLGSEYPEYIADTQAPVIEEMYIDSPDFADGDAVADTFTIYAKVASDESGLKITTGQIGGSSRIVIDDSRIINVSGSSLLVNNDGTIEISVPVNNIADGPHTATLYVTDNVGNKAASTINFVVINQPAVATLTVAEHPARTQASLDIAHSFNGTPRGRLVIEDAHGNTVYTRPDVTMPFEWDLTDGTNPVADGIYHAYFILQSGLQYGSTAKVRITVVQQ